MCAQSPNHRHRNSKAFEEHIQTSVSSGFVTEHCLYNSLRSGVMAVWKLFTLANDAASVPERLTTRARQHMADDRDTQSRNGTCRPLYNHLWAHGIRVRTPYTAH